MPETSQPLSPFNVNRWFPSDFHRGPNIVVWIGLLSTFIAVFIKLWTPTSINRFPESLATLLFLGILVHQWRVLKREPIVWLLFLFILVPILLFGIHYLQSPETALAYESTDKMARLMLFLPFGWWLGNSPRTWYTFFAIALFGFMIGVFVNPEFSDSLAKALDGQRAGWGLINWQHTAMYSGTALIAALCFGPTILSATNKRARFVGGLLFGIALLWAIAGVITTQTRATWLGLAICGVIATLGTLIWIIRSKNNKHRNKAIITLGILTIIVLGVVPITAKPVLERFQTEMTVVEPLLAGDFENIPPNSMGVRLETWIIAAQWIEKRPFTGWGGDVRDTAISSSEKLSPFVECCIRHFHNTFIEFTISYGFIGLLTLLAVFIYMLARSINLWKAGCASTMLVTFTALITLYYFVINIFESYLFFWSGAFIISIAYAPITSCILRANLTSIKNKRIEHQVTAR
ncbi:O-antigen ligase family protein [Saccharospirillum alexandrii]|uniref:O-antigen ligase family protein n=1 Tax=Saccharospirillum alexandrii TaxID=2448477 RepID=UPI000FDC6FC7|nr:O-antigen ligase family protein [Saccharospirillum alexandrii]